MKNNTGRPITKIQNDILGAMIILTVVMTVLTIIVSVCIELRSEKSNIDNNLQNIAYTITESSAIKNEMQNERFEDPSCTDYLDSLKSSLSNVDVISIVSSSGTRLYHTNKDLVGTTYDGTVPDFEQNGNMYITNDTGPSGAQRRVYAAIYSDNGEFLGFVLVVILNQNINRMILRTILTYLFLGLVVIVISAYISTKIAHKIKHKLWGYEPDAFSAMYSVRNNVLESFEEGVIAIDYDEKMLFMNKAACHILGTGEDYSLNLKDYPVLSRKLIRKVLSENTRILGEQARTSENADILINYYPVNENGRLIGALCVLIDRTEYTKIAEDLSGVRFLVESMRANNHDFINKLHVILGLIQMGESSKAAEYISNITSIQQETISNIMRNIEDPSLAALLIGKYSRASELNISFALEAGSHYAREDVSFNSNDLITVTGNLIENAFEAIDSSDTDNKEVSVGIFTEPGAIIIRVDDSGPGIPKTIQDELFDNGVTTKGSEHGTGLFQVDQIVKRCNGTITFDTVEGEGTLFTVTMLSKTGDKDNV